MGLSERERDRDRDRRRRIPGVDYHIIECVRPISLKNNNYSDCRKNPAMRINRSGLSCAAVAE